MCNLDSFVDVQSPGKTDELQNQVLLAFFASLFADRHGVIYNMSERSSLASLLLLLYSSFNSLQLSKERIACAFTLTDSDGEDVRQRSSQLRSESCV